jgi:hypothetical protein
MYVRADLRKLDVLGVDGVVQGVGKLVEVLWEEGASGEW